MAFLPRSGFIASSITHIGHMDCKIMIHLITEKNVKCKNQLQIEKVNFIGRMPT